jgi:sarcosine oxidase
VRRYDVIVIGVGAMGASACARLAARGARVLGLERFAVPHELGSSGGDTRLFRTAYFEHPDYVPLLRHARAGWEDLEAASGRTVFRETGLLYAGPPEGSLIADTLASARAYGVPIEVVDSARRRFPWFRLPEEFAALFEPGGGLVLSLEAIRAFADVARSHGADLLEGEAVQRWSAGAGGVRVDTDRASYEADQLILAAGAWTPSLAPALAGALRVTRQSFGWVEPEGVERFVPPTFPSWAIEDPEDGLYYGFPFVAAGTPGAVRSGLKVARHVPGAAADPDTVDRTPGDADEADFRSALERYLPAVAGPPSATRICLYTNSPDGQFLVGRLPGEDRVSVACGFSGHGFKFAPAIGDALADLALEGRSALPIGFLDPGRALAGHPNRESVMESRSPSAAPGTEASRTGPRRTPR